MLSEHIQQDTAQDRPTGPRLLAPNPFEVESVFPEPAGTARAVGFTTLAMEASPSAARALDTYVRCGTGSPERLVARPGFWTWRTREMVGTDPQLCGDSVEAVTAFLRRTAPDQAGRLGALDVLARARPGSLPDPEKALMRHAEEIARLVADHVERSGPDDDAVGAHCPPWGRGLGSGAFAPPHEKAYGSASPE
ncbi:erythromycin esterase family protein [Streptomyces sp. NPDC055005]